jgi:hypothetical protein
VGSSKLWQEIEEALAVIIEHGGELFESGGVFFEDLRLKEGAAEH